MVGPKSTSDQFRPNRSGRTRQFWQSDRSRKEHAECELCESETLTNVQYGLRVCHACDRTYLP